MEPATIQVNIELFGLIETQQLLRAFYLSDVRDLVDTIQRIESMHGFLRYVKYDVNVNGLKTDQNQLLHSGDKIVIRPIKVSI